MRRHHWPVVTTGPDTRVKPLLPPQLRTRESGDGRRASYLELFFDLVVGLVVLVLVGGLLVPLVFVGLTATTLVLVVVLKLWTAQRPLRSRAA